MPPTPFSGPPSSGPRSAAATGAPDARLDARRLRSLIVISFSASVAFTAMYSTQPILPQISQEFHVSPAEAGLTLLAVTFALAVASLGAGRIADAIGTRRMMLICGILLSVFSVAAPLAPTFASLVALRVAQGLAVPGITIAGLAYLHNELPPAWRGRVSGFYIAANTLGGLLGRLMVGLTVETLGWRGGLALVAGWVILGTLALAIAIAPSSRRRPVTTSTTPQPSARNGSARPPSLAVIIRKLWWAPLIGGTIFLPFLTVFSYAPYLLEGPPFHLSPTRTSLIYLVYLLGAVASPVAGNISDRMGRRPTIQVSLAIAFAGLACTLVDMLPLILLGLALVCIGSLMAHVVANASVSDAANPLGAQARATALALYTLGFYLGGGIGSFVPGLAFVAFGWNGVIALCVVAVVGAFLCSLVTSAHPVRGAYVEPTATAG
ncbi:MAG TPA: MFS transporter [Ktedonobacterales bacterium]|nr:MFS transporter [Ktedonobacterales bacterium]